MATFVIFHNGRLQGICRSAGDVEQHLSVWAEARLEEQRFSDQMLASHPKYTYKVVRKIPIITHKTSKVVLPMMDQVLDMTEYSLAFEREVQENIGKYTLTDYISFMVYTFPDLEVSA